MSRDTRANVGEETVRILASGTYVAPNGNTVDIGSTLRAAKNGTELLLPEELLALSRVPLAHVSATNISVSNQTTLAAVRRLREQQEQSVICLNFASARNPGGGFLNGAQAQEESLARASGLYACQHMVPEFYETHRANRDLRYSHRLIYSPGVPVFRNDEDVLLNEPFTTSIITMAAPNLGAIRTQQPERLETVGETFLERALLLLRFCSSRSYECLVLGAWGCGVFGNDAATVAAMFRSLLSTEFENTFKTVIFAVFDQSKSQPTYGAFRDVFA
jgi:uncharacterized protein (TIGR02452 family)